MHLDQVLKNLLQIKLINPKTKVRNVFDIATKLHGQGVKNITMIAGSDRVKEFERLLESYNGVEGKRHGYYKFDSIKVISAGERDPDAEGVEGMSASKLRALAADGDFESFKKGLPRAAKGTVAQELFNTVQKSIGKKALTKEGIELWRIAPKFDFKGLREQFIAGNVFNIGSLET